MAEKKGYQGRKDGAETTIADPEGNFVFALEIDSVQVANFLECSGLKTSTEVFEIEEGGNNQFTHKLPGRSKWENLVLKYGVTSDISLLSWRNEVLAGQFEARRSGAVLMMSVAGKVIRRYSFQNAWPVSWEGPSFNASSAELAIETLEIAHEGLTITVEG